MHWRPIPAPSALRRRRSSHPPTLSLSRTGVLSQVVAVLLEHLQAGVSDTLELLPKCLTLLAERGDVPGGDDDEAGEAPLLSGREFCTATLDQVSLHCESHKGLLQCKAPVLSGFIKSNPSCL